MGMTYAGFRTDEGRRVPSFQKEYAVVSGVRYEMASASEVGDRARIPNFGCRCRTSISSCESGRSRSENGSRCRVAYDVGRMVDEISRYRFRSRRRVGFEKFQYFAGSGKVGSARVRVAYAGDVLGHEHGERKGSSNVLQHDSAAVWRLESSRIEEPASKRRHFPHCGIEIRRGGVFFDSLTDLEGIFYSASHENRHPRHDDGGNGHADEEFGKSESAGVSHFSVLRREFFR